MSWTSTDVGGTKMWENESGERLKDPETRPNMYGWHKIDVDGLVMWESPEGERLTGDR